MEKAAFDPERFKAQERAGFNLVANQYEDSMHQAQPATLQLLAMGDLSEGLRVLDVATGPGIVARQAARLVGTGQVVGVDIAEEAIEVARQKAVQEKLTNVSFQVGDAEALDFEAGSFDRVFCAMGLMHFPHPEQALTEFKRVLKPGGKLLASVWSEEADSPFIAVALQTLNRTFPPPKVARPSMFRFGNPTVLAQLVETVGFSEVEVQPVQLEAFFPDAASYWRIFLGAAGITAVALAKQPAEIHQKLEQEVAQDLAPYAKDGGYFLTSIIQVVKASK